MSTELMIRKKNTSGVVPLFIQVLGLYYTNIHCIQHVEHLFMLRNKDTPKAEYIVSFHMNFLNLLRLFVMM